jgi:hypothetical protein
MKIKTIVMSVIALVFFSSASVTFAYHGDEKEKAKEHMMKDKDMCKEMKEHHMEGKHKKKHDMKMKDMDKEAKGKMKEKYKKMKEKCAMKDKEKKPAK